MSTETTDYMRSPERATAVRERMAEERAKRDAEADDPALIERIDSAASRWCNLRDGAIEWNPEPAPETAPRGAVSDRRYVDIEWNPEPEPEADKERPTDSVHRSEPNAATGDVAPSTCCERRHADRLAAADGDEDFAAWLDAEEWVTEALEGLRMLTANLSRSAGVRPAAQMTGLTVGTIRRWSEEIPVEPVLGVARARRAVRGLSDEELLALS